MTMVKAIATSTTMEAEVNDRAILEIIRNEDIERVKEKEVEDSRRDFGGFNINYERRKVSTAMKHFN